MAFVTIDNPGGILHHGAQMAWTYISDTRIAMVTITADFKALVQEINQVSGAPVVGAPSFIAQLGDVAGLDAGVWFRPKIRSMGNNRIFVMVPTVWAVPTQAQRTAGWGSQVTNSTTDRNNVRMPTQYTGYVMERDASGLYAVKSSVAIDTMGGNAAAVSSHFALTINSATDTQISVRRSIVRPNQTVYSLYSVLVTIPVTDGVLGVPVVTEDIVAYASNFLSGLQVFDYKNARDIQNRSVELYAIGANGTSSYESYTARMMWRPPITGVVKDPCYLVGGGTYNTTYTYRSAPQLNYVQPNSLVPLSADVQGDYYAVGGGSTAVSALYNANPISTADLLINPLDTAFVNTDGVVCVAGGKNTVTGVLTSFENDAGVHVYQTFIGTVVDNVLPLKLSFRLPVGAGQYVGPYDPIQTPYFYKERMNLSRVIHRVDNTHFWLIGCFMADANAVPKLGVISVNV